MDLLTLAILITFFVLAVGGSANAIKKRRIALERLRLQESLRAHRRLEDQRISLFDIFWDLGASGFALELMAHYDLLPRGEADVYGSWSRLEDLVNQHGNYEAFLSDSLEAIQEFYDEHRHAGHRRLLPGLTDASRRTILVPRRLETDPPSFSPLSRERPTESSLKERRNLRIGRQDPGLIAQSAPSAQDQVDLDHVTDFSALDVLQSLVDGNLGKEFEKWWKLRRLRQKRQELDKALSDFYDFYADVARRHQNFYDPLYDAHQRWKDEATRLRFEARQRPWSHQNFALTADVLFEEAIDLAERLASRAYESTYHSIEAIHHYVRDGKKPMAGYLVFLNRHALFAGRHPGYSEHARKVEFATHRVREEIVALRDKGLL